MNRDELLEKQLALVRPYVDIIRICDGVRRRETKHICKEYDAEYYYRKWDDNFSAQDNVLFSKANEDEWILNMDSDEFPSKILLQNLEKLADQGEYNCVRIPSITVLDEIPECTIEDRIQQTKDKRDIFRKDWFLKFTKGIHSTGSPHRGFIHPTGWIYHDTGYPYYHLKTTDDFIFNDCIHAFINPEGQGYTDEEANEFRNYKCIKRLKLSTQVIPMLQKGEVSQDFIDFMWKHKDKNRPISRWFWVYYFIFHPELFFETNNVSYQNYVQHKKGYKGNIFGPQPNIPFEL